MKILSPLDSVDEVEKLAEAGAQEFYCGLLEETWYEKYPVISINRRPAGRGHFRSFHDLRAAVERAHSCNIPVFFTLNEHYYINSQYPLLSKYINEAVEAHVDAFIVSDFGLMAYLQEKECDVPLHVSTGGTVFNWRTVKFYKDLGCERITFPRHLSIDEIGEIMSKMPIVDTSVFVLNSRCINVDGFCTFQHGLAGKNVFPMFRNACMLPFKVDIQSSIQLQQESLRLVIERQKIWEKVHVDDHPCGACALYEFAAMGLSSIKIVGRGNSVERKIKDVLFLRKLLSYLIDGCSDEKMFRKKAQTLYQKAYNRPCRPHMCYYPSVMLK